MEQIRKVPVYHCNPCNKKMPIIEKNSHNKSKKHLKMLLGKASHTSTTLCIKKGGDRFDFKTYKSFFEQFGQVRFVKLNQVSNEVEIVFAQLSGMLSAMKVKENLYLKGSKLLVTTKPKSNVTPVQHSTNDGPKLKNPPKPSYGVPPKIEMPPASSLELHGDFEQQLETLMGEIRLKPHTVETLRYLCEDTHKALSKKFASIRVIPFGSIVNGLAILDSDVDCFVEIPEKHGAYGAARKDNYSYTNINLAKKALLSHPDLFSHVFKIPAKIPIIKFRHIPTGFNVDINFTSPFGIINTNLIRFFISTDFRLIPLFVLIKYWAKLNELTGPNKFSNYSIILMVIFYLQRLVKPILPPVNFLQNDPRCDIIKEGWNVGFDTSLNNFPQNHNDSNVFTLLEGFFHFYSNLQLDTLVLSPLTGLSLPISTFQDVTQLPPDYHRYVSLLNVTKTPIRSFPISKTLNVQDPFELNRNVTVSVSHKVKTSFLSACATGLMKFQDARETQCFEGFLHKLLNTDAKTENIPFNVKKVYPINMPGIIPNQLVTLYGERLKSLVENILTNVLKCKFTEKFKSNKQTILSYKCDSFYNLWSIRKNHIDQVKGDQSTLSWYVSVSDHILNLLYKNQLPTCPLFSFTIEVDVSIQQKNIFIVLGNTSAPKLMFVEFIDFITGVFDMGMNSVLDN